MDSQVVFGIDGDRVPVQYDRSRLGLGAIVYVSRDSSGKPLRFATDAHPGSEEYAVTWISPSEWYVSLSSGWRIEGTLIDSVHDVVKENLKREVVERACLTAAKGIRLQHLYKTSEFERSRLNTILSVAARLDLVGRIGSKEVAKALWHHYEPLVVYLMLTCFDTLGSPEDWLAFSAWLEAKRSAEERQHVVDELNAVDPVESSSALYRRWLDLYGVRTAFHRFIRQVLPPDVRKALLDSIRIDILTVPPNIQRREADDHFKEAWLFELRNRYTHKAQFVPGVSRAVFLDELIPNDAWMGMRQQRIEAMEWNSVDLHGWPNIVVTTVRAGLASYLSRLAHGGAA